MGRSLWVTGLLLVGWVPQANAAPSLAPCLEELDGAARRISPNEQGKLSKAAALRLRAIADLYIAWTGARAKEVRDCSPPAVEGAITSRTFWLGRQADPDAARAARNGKLAQLDSQMPAPEQGIDARLMDRELLAEFFARLSPEDAVVFALDALGLTSKEIAVAFLRQAEVKGLCAPCRLLIPGAPGVGAEVGEELGGVRASIPSSDVDREAARVRQRKASALKAFEVALTELPGTADAPDVLSHPSMKAQYAVEVDGQGGLWLRYLGVAAPWPPPVDAAFRKPAAESAKMSFGKFVSDAVPIAEVVVGWPLMMGGLYILGELLKFLLAFGVGIVGGAGARGQGNEMVRSDVLQDVGGRSERRERHRAEEMDAPAASSTDAGVESKGRTEPG